MNLLSTANFASWCCKNLYVKQLQHLGEVMGLLDERVSNLLMRPP